VNVTAVSTTHASGQWAAGRESNDRTYRSDRMPGIAPEGRLDSATTEGQKGNSWASDNAVLTYLISHALSYVALYGVSQGRTRTPE